MERWIERKIMPHIMEAIRATDRSTHVFYITSTGGEGKTVLLRQIGMQLGSPDGIAPCPRWSGILDLYHSDVNSNHGLEEHIGQALKTVLDEFEPYHRERRTFAQLHESGLLGPQLEAERERIAQVFAACVNAVTNWRRVVIALDTTERIQYEVDEVQRLCEIESESTTVKDWLLDQLCRWQNCVVLLAGRPEKTPYLSSALDAAFRKGSKVRYTPMTLGSFDQEEADEYFELKKKAFPVLDELDEEFYPRLLEVTEGRPIRLDLAIEVVRYGLGIDRLWQDMKAGEPEQVRAEIDRMLIDHVMRGEYDPLIGDILLYLAVARKGLDAELLQYLGGEEDLDACRKQLETVAELGFVKRHAEEAERLYLHDEMYQLCDTHLLRGEEVQRLSQRIAEWYDAQIRSPGDKVEPADLQIDSLLYRLRANPRDGYHWYARLAEYAIRAAQIGFDMRLRNELIAFENSSSPIDIQLLKGASGLQAEIDCDCAARWVKRFSVRGENARALQIAEQVLGSRSGPCQAGDPKSELARADLRVFQSQAMMYTGHYQPAVDLLRAAIKGLEDASFSEEPVQSGQSRYMDWRRNLVLGRAHNNLGYIHWRYLGQYEAAIHEFYNALAYFRDPELQEEWANTKDNIGRVYALCHRAIQAGANIKDGLDLRRRLGLNYRIALSLHSWASVHLEFGEYTQARRLSEEALAMFEDLGIQRGIGLASITRGKALRRLGSAWVPGISSSREFDDLLNQGVDCLNRAVRIFTDRVNEPEHLVEALNELGSIYREQARLLQAMTPGNPDIEATAREAILRFETSVAQAESMGLRIWYIDSCEDLAQVHFMLGEYAESDAWLTKAEGRVPQEYLFNKNEPPAEIPLMERIDPMWLQMGKVELLRGSIVFDQNMAYGSRAPTRDILEEAVRHYVLSVSYFEKYSTSEKGLQNTFGQMYDRLRHVPVEDLAHLQSETLPDLAETYGIDVSRSAEFLADTLGLAPQWERLA